jgi:hypothetical protein
MTNLIGREALDWPIAPPVSTSTASARPGTDARWAMSRGFSPEEGAASADFHWLGMSTSRPGARTKQNRSANVAGKVFDNPEK